MPPTLGSDRLRTTTQYRSSNVKISRYIFFKKLNIKRCLLRCFLIHVFIFHGMYQTNIYKQECADMLIHVNKFLLFFFYILNA